jgi:hypothetical protein
MEPLIEKKFPGTEARSATPLRDKKIDAEAIRGISARMMPQSV